MWLRLNSALHHKYLLCAPDFAQLLGTKNEKNKIIVINQELETG